MVHKLLFILGMVVCGLCNILVPLIHVRVPLLKSFRMGFQYDKHQRMKELLFGCLLSVQWLHEEFLKKKFFCF